MINRRGALAAIAVAVFGGVESFISKGLRFRQSSPAQTSFTAFGAELVDTSDDNMRADLASLGKHVYSEEGIPMFLACINLSAPRTAHEQAQSPSALNQKVESAFQRYADGWQRMRPEAPASDVAKIIELLANRDFTAGGTERTL